MRDDLKNRYETLYSKGYGDDPDADAAPGAEPEDPYRTEQYNLYVKYKTAYAQCVEVLE